MHAPPFKSPMTCVRSLPSNSCAVIAGTMGYTSPAPIPSTAAVAMRISAVGQGIRRNPQDENDRSDDHERALVDEFGKVPATKMTATMTPRRDGKREVDGCGIVELLHDESEDGHVEGPLEPAPSMLLRMREALTRFRPPPRLHAGRHDTPCVRLTRDDCCRAIRQIACGIVDWVPLSKPVHDCRKRTAVESGFHTACMKRV